MKTTIDLPDELALQAKTAALSRKTTLRNLVVRGLEREIRHPSPGPQSPIRGLLNLNTQVWRDTASDEYVATLRKDWA